MDLTQKREQFFQRATKAGIKAGNRIGEPLDTEELLALKVQVMPWFWRAALVAVGIGNVVVGSWIAADKGDAPWWAVGLVLLGIALALFGAFGVKRTVESMIDLLDYADAIELTYQLGKNVAKGIGKFFDSADGSL